MGKSVLPSDEYWQCLQTSGTAHRLPCW